MNKNLLLVVAFLWLMATPMAAEAARDFSGYAWSETVGWISLSGPGYGLVADETTGLLSGYAWSENVGWVSANQSDLTGCPLGGPCEARINSSEQLTGWLRVLSGGTPESGGFTGWIRLRGTRTDIVTGNVFTYGPTINTTGAISGYGWGSMVVGWVDFSYAQITPRIPATPTASAQCSDTTNNATFTWNTVPIATNYRLELTNASTGVTTTINDDASPQVRTGMGWGRYSWNLAACAAGGCSAPTPTVNLVCSPPPANIDLNSVVQLQTAGESARLYWRIEAPYPMTCSLRGGNAPQTITHTGGITEVTEAAPFVTSPLSFTTIFTLSCTPQVPGFTLADVTDEVRVEIVPRYQNR